MRFTFDYDRAELIRAHRQVARHTESRWRYTNRVLVSVGVVAAIMVVVIPRWADVSLRVAVWALVLPFWFWLCGWIMLPLSARQFERQRPDSAHPLSAALGEGGYEVTSFSGTTLLKWVGIRRALETAEFLLIYITKSHAYYLPKRAIRSADELNAVRRLLREHLGDRAKLMDDSEPHSRNPGG